MTQQEPSENTARPLDEHARDATSPPTRKPIHLAPAPTSIVRPPSEQAGTCVRLCVLCGAPLRVGQRLLRVHGTTVHARCTSI